MNPETFAVLLIREASRFIGLRETKPNAEWDNPATPGPDDALVKELRAVMQPSPWKPGWAYCAAFVEGMVANAFTMSELPAAERARAVTEWRRKMTPHVLTSWRVFQKRCVAVPASGCIWFARHGATDQGHCGIVTSVRGSTMTTIEANTSADSALLQGRARDAAKEREGDWITPRIRNVSGVGTLRTLGFLPPAALLAAVEISTSARR